MNYKFKIMGSGLALTFMLLFGVVAFAHTANQSMAKPAISSALMSPAGNDRMEKHHHRRHHRHRHYHRHLRG